MPIRLEILFGIENIMQPKKFFASVDYKKCNPKECNPDNGLCMAAQKCSHKVIKQLDGGFEPPVLFHDMCMGCMDCMEACRLDAIQIRYAG